MKSHVLLLSLPLVLTAACGDPPVRIRADQEQASQAAEPSPVHGDAAGSDSVHGSTSPFKFVEQEGWISEPPSNNFRKAQYRLPAVEGDPDDATLVVITFPGGGTVDDNFTRWCMQFLQDDGRPSTEAAARDVEEREGFRFHTIDVSGRYVAETQPGSGERVNLPEYRLLGCVIETGGSPYFVKMVGPAETMERWQASFYAFLKAMV